MQKIEETWYLLYDGTSVDGCGEAQYIGRTIDWYTAQQHYIKVCQSPYSTGYVQIVTDNNSKRWWGYPK